MSFELLSCQEGGIRRHTDLIHRMTSFCSLSLKILYLILLSEAEAIWDLLGISVKTHSLSM